MQQPYNQPIGQSRNVRGTPKLPMYCFVIAIIDLSLGGLTLVSAPLSFLSLAVLPEGAPILDYMIPSVLVMLLIGGSAVAADLMMLKKQPSAVVLGYVNIAAMVIGIIFVWVQLPAQIESQEMQLAADPNAQNMPPAMEGMMTTLAVGGAVFTSCFRLTLIILVGIALMKFKAWQAKS